MISIRSSRRSRPRSGSRCKVDPKWIKTAADERAVAEGGYFDSGAAERVRTFLRYLHHFEGEWAGKPFELQPWQWEQIIAPLFGWKQASGVRRFRRAYIEIPRKNGKSSLLAAIALYLLMADNEPGAYVFSAANDATQSNVVFQSAAGMLDASPWFSRKLKQQSLEVIPSTGRIVYHPTGSYYKALSSKAPSKHGLNIHGLIFDELHALSSLELWNALTTASGARRQPLLVAITTAGFDRESICWEQHEIAKAILSGEDDNPSYFPFISAAPPEADWTSEAVWKIANPAYGITVNPAELHDACRMAKRMATQENAFRQLHLNQWTQQSVRWLKLTDWDACERTMEQLTDEGRVMADPLAVDEAVPELYGRPCFGGLDLSSTTDLSALSLVFPLEPPDDEPSEEPEDDEEAEEPKLRRGGYYVLNYFWAPSEIAKERERLNRQRYDKWIHAGYIEETEGNVIDYDVIRAFVNELCRYYDIRGIAIDRWNATHLTTQLTGDGVRVLPFGQGYASMTAPTKEFEKLIMAQRIWHPPNPVMRWMVGNVVVDRDAAGNLKPTKDPKKCREKIDGVVATIMALGLSISEPEDAEPGVFLI